MKEVIKIEKLNKYYGKFHALKDIDLTIKKGEVFGLLGPNGAGKSTLVKVILDLTNYSTGSVTISELSSKNQNARANLAYLPEKFNFYDFYKVKDVLSFYAKMKGVINKEQIKKSIIKLNIYDIKDNKLSKLSKGQLQRVGIASILLGNNEIIILDEPFSGLDPIGIKELKDIILELKNQGKTIIINSNILSELEKICTHIGIIIKGKLVKTGSIKNISEGSSLEDFFFKKVAEND